jgi:hypothetical protein
VARRARATAGPQSFDLRGSAAPARPQCSRFVTVTLASEAVPAPVQMGPSHRRAARFDPMPAKLTPQPGRSHNIAENQSQLICMRLRTTLLT